MSEYIQDIKKPSVLENGFVVSSIVGNIIIGFQMTAEEADSVVTFKANDDERTITTRDMEGKPYSSFEINHSYGYHPIGVLPTGKIVVKDSGEEGRPPSFDLFAPNGNKLDTIILETGSEVIGVSGNDVIAIHMGEHDITDPNSKRGFDKINLIDPNTGESKTIIENQLKNSILSTTINKDTIFYTERSGEEGFYYVRTYSISTGEKLEGKLESDVFFINGLTNGKVLTSYDDRTKFFETDNIADIRTSIQLQNLETGEIDTIYSDAQDGSEFVNYYSAVGNDVYLTIVSNGKEKLVKYDGDTLEGEIIYTFDETSVRDLVQDENDNLFIRENYDGYRIITPNGESTFYPAKDIVNIYAGNIENHSFHPLPLLIALNAIWVYKIAKYFRK